MIQYLALQASCSCNPPNHHKCLDSRLRAKCFSKSKRHTKNCRFSYWLFIDNHISCWVFFISTIRFTLLLVMNDRNIAANFQHRRTADVTKLLLQPCYHLAIKQTFMLNSAQPRATGRYGRVADVQHNIFDRRLSLANGTWPSSGIGHPIFILRGVLVISVSKVCVAKT